jgi:outer membrane lipoprotein carrier protein
VLVVAGAVGAQAPAASHLTAAALAKKVDAHYNHLGSLEARYTERYRGMGMDRTESGTLLLKKPGRMRWSYDSPAGKVFSMDGKWAVSYTPGDAEADRVPARQMDDLHSPLAFLLGHAELGKELEGLALTEVQGGYTLSGTPKGMQNKVRLIGLTVDAGGVIHAMRMEDADGSVTEFTFSGIKENVPATDADFRFTPPAGVTMVDGAAPI